MRRDRAGSVHDTPPGGNVEDGEDFCQALARELAEGLCAVPPRAERLL
ncbi:NUDIX domain-containing protein [Streptomyces flaveolus]